MNRKIQENELEKLQGFIIVQNRTTYTTYNEIITCLKNYCTQYLHILDTGRYDDEGGTTKLDRHRVNLCREKIESILKMIKVNGYLHNNHYVKIAMIHAYQYLHKIRELCDDVSLFVSTAQGEKIRFQITVPHPSFLLRG